MTTIIHNRAKCKACGDIIESFHVHDWKACSCGDIFVDGGHDYCRAGAHNIDNFIAMYEVIDNEDLEGLSENEDPDMAER